MSADIWRATLRQLWLDPRRGFSNFRFLVAMRIGGFDTASRPSPVADDEHADRALKDRAMAAWYPYQPARTDEGEGEK